MNTFVRALRAGALASAHRQQALRSAHTAARRKFMAPTLTLPRTPTHPIAVPSMQLVPSKLYSTQGTERRENETQEPHDFMDDLFEEDWDKSYADEFEESPVGDLAGLGREKFTKEMMEHGSVVNSFTLEDMMKAKVHYGHHRSMWNPLMEPYLYGVREDIHIFDLDQTAVHLRRALSVLRALANRNGIILFVGARPQFEGLIRKTAVDCGEYFVSKKWVNGALTNRAQTLKANVLPDLIVFLTVPASRAALKESYLLNIPSIGIIDSDSDPFSVTYAIPGNDDSYSAMEFYCDLMSKAIKEGKHCRKHGIPL
eukprot:comp23741_c0_seq1/m.40976 comp23741_c0_seq1/g.40976  ORF comp23741_c0_seq1/g.40976 comp23741_c0_seq1/m.40976 type:complete len:313 (-) comp23741_c0_seq1:30-968(-)